MPRRATSKRGVPDTAPGAPVLKKSKTSVNNDYTTHAKVIKTVFGMEMPDDIFLFWKFCKKISARETLHAIPGLKLVGPFQVLQNISRFEEINKVSIKHLMDDRYYYDSPEFLTVLANIKSSYHIGIFRDDEKEKSCIYVSNNGKTSKLTILGDNLFAAVYQYLQVQGSTTKSLLKKLSQFAEESNLRLDVNSDGVNDRKRNVVAKCFHGAGIVVPIENEVGYRPVGGTYSKWEKLFTRIDKAPNDDERRKLFGEIQETITYIQFANDECDYGMGLELGMNMFCHGSQYLNKTASRLLTMAYKLLKRDLYAQIIEEHLKNR